MIDLTESPGREYEGTPPSAQESPARPAFERARVVEPPMYHGQPPPQHLLRTRYRTTSVSNHQSPFDVVSSVQLKVLENCAFRLLGFTLYFDFVKFSV